jgi:amino acid permease
MDRIFFYQWGPVKNLQDHHRWMILTGFMALSAFFVANAIPFFKDLVALIGALTSVPLTLLLPALFHRKVLAVPIWCPTKESLVSYALVLFSLLFIIAALIGSVNSIVSDWEHHQGGFFACN